MKEKTTKFLENFLGFLGNRLSFNDTSKLTEVKKYLDYFIIQYKDIRVEPPEYNTTVIHENYTLDMERIWFQVITYHVNQFAKRKIELLTAKRLGIMNPDIPILNIRRAGLFI